VNRIYKIFLALSVASLLSVLFAVSANAAPAAAPRATATPTGASLTLSPTTKTVRVGQTIDITIKVDSRITPINAVQANLSFPATKFACSSITVNGTSWPVTAEKTCSNGLVKVAVGSFTPRTGSVVVATVKLKATATGQATVTFADGTDVIDSVNNQSVLKSSGRAVYTITR
jgi:hypothetical protein